MSDGTVTFKEIMETQFRLQRSMGFPGTAKDGSTYSEQGAKEMLLAAMVECSEALGEFSWKCWKPEGYKKVDRKAMATELTDIIQFVANAAIYLDLGPADLSNALRLKWEVNFERTRQGETTRE